MSLHSADVQRLVADAMDSGRSAEEVCRDQPELLPAVRDRLAQCRLVHAALDDLFPPSPLPSGYRLDGQSSTLTIDAVASDSGTPADATGDGPAGLPRVPGYAVEAVLGRGGMGVVYRARDLRLGRTVALKMIGAGPHASRSERTRFMREARAVAALRHPHVVQVHDVGEHAGRPYFTMERVTGGSLADRLARDGKPMAPRDAAATLRPLALALATAHAAGIVHRDLKPANVLLETDGTPKLSDFGLARRTAAPLVTDTPLPTIAGDAPTPASGDPTALAAAMDAFDADVDGLTQGGARLGTPSYMAPEQVMGGAGAGGPLVDVYGLGAVLYEVLTGRPPFRGDSSAQTVRQLLAATDGPTAPSRLNRRVPRDLELVCLTCLRRDPLRRYASAQALADDLGRFLRGEPIAARRTGPAARAVKWARRRPAAAAAAVAALLLIGGAIGVAADRAATVRAAADDLADAAARQRTGDWPAARLALDRAALRLGDPGAGGPLAWVTGAGGPAHLRAALDRARRDSTLVPQLEAIRLDRAISTGGVLDVNAPNDQYAALFRAAGIGEEPDPPAVVAARIRASNVRRVLMTALADWARCREPHARDWLLAVESAADPDATGWRDRARTQARQRNRAAIATLIADPAALTQPVDVQLALADDYAAVGGDPVPFMLKIQQAHPSDFWANYLLGASIVLNGDPAEGLRYLQAANALRPDVASVHFSIGATLNGAGRYDEALVALRRSLALDPKAFLTLIEVGRTHTNAGRPVEAIKAMRDAVGLRPDSAQVHNALAQTLAAAGIEHCDEAVKHFRQALVLNDKLVESHRGLREALVRLERPKEALEVWRAAMAAQPTELWLRSGYAEYCMYLAMKNDYRTAARRGLDLINSETAPRDCEHAGRAALLLPVGGPDLADATRAIERALSSEATARTWLYPYFMFAKALSEYRHDRHAAALAICEGDARGVLGPAPHLLSAMCHVQLKQPTAARAAMAKAALAFDWRTDFATHADAWMYHVLMREATTDALMRSTEYRDNRYHPTDADGRIGFLPIYEATTGYAVAARLWSDVAATDAERFAPHHLRAARMAMLAGCGIGHDAETTTAADRADLRAQARRWILADLPRIEAGAAERDEKRAALFTNAAAQFARDLAVLQAPDRLPTWPADEQSEWAAILSRFTKAAAVASSAG